jgi:dephospho-CoA kinase
MRDVANDLRKQHGPAYVIERLYKLAADESDAVIESVRTLGEAEFLHGKGAIILAVDADQHLRYDRVVKRGSETDSIPFETFQAQEAIEMASSEPWDMNVFGVMQLADARIENNGTLEELHQKIEEALVECLKKLPPKSEAE